VAEQVIHENARTARADIVAERLVYTAAKTAAISPVPLPRLGAKDILIQALKSGISRGTESLVFAGKVPRSEWERMRCPHQTGDFSFPLSYGYALVAHVLETGEDVENIAPGERVFVLHPHQSHAVVGADMANKIPASIPSRRAVLAANMETALNAIWDSGLTADDGDKKIAVIGGGVVGLLTGFLAQKTTGAPVTLIDIDATKRKAANALGLSFSSPQEVVAGYDVIFHTSASGSGLQTALGLAAFEGLIVEMSWYGDKEISLKLGGAFHSQRLRMIASQVGHVSPSRRVSTTYRARMAEAIGFLDDPTLDALLEDEIAFKALPQHLERIFGPTSQTLCQVVDYEINPSGD